MRNKTAIGAMTLILTGGVVWADEAPIPDDKEAMEEALEQCSVNSNGDMNAMESCMINKGFSKPQGVPPQQSGNGEPPTGQPPQF